MFPLKNKTMRFFFKIVITAFSFIALVSTTNVFAAPVVTPQIPPRLILSWSASSIHPSNYKGKVLPSLNTPIVVSVELLANGKFADISKTTIIWRKSGEVIKRGVGLKQIFIAPDSNDSSDVFIDAEVDFANNIVEQSLLIPVVKPFVSIEIPYPNSVVRGDSDVTIRATPYFFNASSLDDLVFYWQIGDIKKNMEQNNSITLKVSGAYSSQDSLPITSYVQSRDVLTDIIVTNKPLFVR